MATKIEIFSLFHLNSFRAGSLIEEARSYPEYAATAPAPAYPPAESYTYSSPAPSVVSFHRPKKVV